MRRFVALLVGAGLVVSGAVREGIAAEPSAAPTVRDAVAQFNALKHHGEALGWRLLEDQGAPDPSARDHYQGVARYPGQGTPILYVTQLDDDDPALPGAPNIGGYLLVARMGTRPTTGERMRSNLQVRGSSTEDTAPDAADTYVRSIRFDGSLLVEGQPLPPYQHPGGMAILDDVLLMSLDQPRVAGSPPGQIVLFDLRPDPADPRPIQSLALSHSIDNLAITRRPDGSLLLWVNGDGGHDTRFYTTSSPDLRSPGLLPVLLEEWDPGAAGALENDVNAACENNNWPTDTDAYQSAGFVRQADAQLFIAMTRNTTAPNLGCDLADLFRVDETSGTFRLTRVASKHMFCNSAGAGRICTFGAAGGAPYVSPSGELLLYSVPHDDQDGFDPDVVRMAEFRHRDVSTEDSPLRRPSADAGGPYQVDEGGTVQLSGSGGPSADRPWVELYDDAGFSDRSIVVDFDDAHLLELEDFDDLDGFGDKTSSVRWRSPPGLDIELFDDRGFSDRKLVLRGTGETEAIADLDDVDFGDKTSSLRWVGAEPAPGSLSFAWDLDDDGQFDDSSSASPSFGLTAQDGVYTVRLRVTDGSGASNSATSTVTVKNVPPSVSIMSPADGSVHQLADPVDVTAPFTDPGTADTHTCSIDWGDGTITAGAVSESNGSGTCTGSRTYASGGSKAIVVTVLDDDDSGSAAVTITVNSPPSCTTVVASPSTLSPPNHELQLVTLAGATDPDGDPVTHVVTGVTQDEPVNGTDDGDTAPDAALVPGRPDQVELRAERSGNGDGRVYRVAFVVSDGQGGSCTGVAIVGVPRSKSKPAVDSGLVFSSL